MSPSSKRGAASTSRPTIATSSMRGSRSAYRTHGWQTGWAEYHPPLTWFARSATARCSLVNRSGSARSAEFPDMPCQPPNLRLKLLAWGGRLAGEGSLLIAAAPDRSLSATRAAAHPAHNHDSKSRRPTTASQALGISPGRPFALDRQRLQSLRLHNRVSECNLLWAPWSECLTHVTAERE